MRLLVMLLLLMLAVKICRCHDDVVGGLAQVLLQTQVKCKTKKHKERGGSIEVNVVEDRWKVDEYI